MIWLVIAALIAVGMAVNYIQGLKDERDIAVNNALLARRILHDQE